MYWRTFTIIGCFLGRGASRVGQPLIGFLSSYGFTTGQKLMSGPLGGMARRLHATLALLHGPSVLFFDETNAGLDP